MRILAEDKLNFAIQIDGIDRIRDTFTRLEKERLKDFSIPFRLMVKNWFDVQRKMFDGEGRVVGEGGVRAKKWYDLSQKYVEWKRKMGYSTKILQMTGKLKRILTDENSATVQKDMMRIRPDTYMVGGWNLIRLHKYGTRKMKARDPFELSKRQREKWREVMRKWVMGEEIRNVL